MHELSTYDIELVSGGRPYDWVPNAQSDWGNRLNDATNMLGNFGSKLGIAIYDWTH
jgi:hypothetical protein